MAKKKQRQQGPHPIRVTVTRYHDARGRRCRSTDPGALKSTEESATYYADLYSGGQRERVSLETDNLALAWDRLRALLKRRHDESLGIRDTYSDAAEVPLAQHIDDWLATVAAGGITAKQLALMRGRVAILREVAGWERLADLTYDSCALALARLREPDAHPSIQPTRAADGTAQGVSPATRNYYLRHIRQFTRWAAGPGRRLRVDPLAGLDTIDTTTDRRHDRHLPTDEEVAKLFEYLEGDARARAGMSGAQRALGYRLAMATGFRSGELRSLTPASFRLDAEPPTVTVEASYSKRRREDAQQLPLWLADQLRAWFESGGECWAAFGRFAGTRVLRPDLAAAGIPYTRAGAGGVALYFDFHSLRHWFVTHIVNLPGISPRTVLAVTRLSTAELAMKTYGHAQASAVGQVVSALPEPGRSQPVRLPDGCTPDATTRNHAKPGKTKAQPKKGRKRKDAGGASP